MQKNGQKIVCATCATGCLIWEKSNSLMCNRREQIFGGIFNTQNLVVRQGKDLFMSCSLNGERYASWMISASRILKSFIFCIISTMKMCVFGYFVPLICCMFVWRKYKKKYDFSSAKHSGFNFSKEKSKLFQQLFTGIFTLGKHST